MIIKNPLYQVSSGEENHQLKNMEKLLICGNYMYLYIYIYIYI